MATAVPASAGGLGEIAVVDAIPDIPESMPDTVAVMPFANRSGVKALSWMSAGVAFMAAEKAERYLGWRPAYGAFVVPHGEPIDDSAEAVAAFAAVHRATYVITGWIKRPEWDLQLGIKLWRVDGGEATRLGTVVGRDDFKHVHRMTGEALTELAGDAGMSVGADARAGLKALPTADFYAFTLFGRGMSHLLGSAGAVDLDKAKKNLVRAIYIDPKLVEAQRVLGDLYLQLAKPKRAAARLEYALELRSDYYPAMSARGRLALLQSDVDRAEGLFGDMLTARPWDLDARYFYGETRWKSGDEDEALLELERVVERDPDHVQARRALVVIHASRGDETGLVTELEHVARLDPNNVDVRVDLGAAYAAVDEPHKAIAAYESVVDDDPNRVHVLKFLGDLHDDIGDLDGSIQYYDRAVEADPDDPRAYFLLGAAYVEKGDDKAAKRIYRRAQKFGQYLAQVYNNLGAIASREGRHQQSIWYLGRAVAKLPDNARFRYNFALSLSITGQLDRADEQIDKGLELDSSFVELHFLRGVVFIRRGDVESAEDAFERALALDPAHPDAAYNIALLAEMKRVLEQGEIVIEGRR
jgi:tetratricopeptide (TPR) repeat protein